MQIIFHIISMGIRIFYTINNCSVLNKVYSFRSKMYNYFRYIHMKRNWNRISSNSLFHFHKILKDICKQVILILGISITCNYLILNYKKSIYHHILKIIKICLKPQHSVEFKKYPMMQSGSHSEQGIFYIGIYEQGNCNEFYF